VGFSLCEGPAGSPPRAVRCLGTARCPCRWGRRLPETAREASELPANLDWSACAFWKGVLSPKARALLAEALEDLPEPEGCAAQVAALYDTPGEGRGS